MKISSANFLYALRHPLRAIRYIRHRDNIPYDRIANFLPTDPVIVEAGAANGVNTLEMAEFWPEATIHAFEPIPTAREALITRTSQYSTRVHVYPYAFADAPGTFQMHVSG